MLSECSLDMFTRDCSVNQSDTQKADGSPHNLAGIQPSNWASFIPSNGPFVMLLGKSKSLLHKPTCLKMHTFLPYLLGIPFTLDFSPVRDVTAISMYMLYGDIKEIGTFSY